MASSGKKYSQANEKYFSLEPRSIKEAIKVVVDASFAKFDESVSLDVNLGIDPSKGDQVVRGSALLPNGTGKKTVVVAFVKGENADKAKAAGADFVGYDDLIEKVLKGWTDFDYAVATPDVMAGLSKLAKVLGPRGLLPSKKSGTVDLDVSGIVSDLKKGRISFRNDKGGSVHSAFGKVSFGTQKLEENLKSLIRAVSSSKPPSSKGKFIKKLVISSTHGIGVTVSADDATLN